MCIIRVHKMLTFPLMGVYYCICFFAGGKDQGLYLMYLMTWHLPSLNIWNLLINEGETSYILMSSISYADMYPPYLPATTYLSVYNIQNSLTTVSFSMHLLMKSYPLVHSWQHLLWYRLYHEENFVINCAIAISCTLYILLHVPRHCFISKDHFERPF